MNVWDRLREKFDAPRFCTTCGAAVEVEDYLGYDGRTGDRKPHWYWHCPKMFVDLDEDGGIRQLQWYGGDRHVAGTGRPRWHAKGAGE